MDKSLSNGDVLNSWKEIARYLDRGVRTVQRWEIDLALPVRRPNGRARTSVLALKTDLDLWLRSCPTEHCLVIGSDGDFSSVASNGDSGLAAESKPGDARYIERNSHGTAQLILDSRKMRQEMRQNRVQLTQAILRLRQSLGSIIVAVPPRASDS